MFRWQNHEDNIMTAQAFWQAIRDGQEIAFRAGADFINDSLTPAQYKNKLKTSD